MNYSLHASCIIRLMQGMFVRFWRGICLRSEEGYLISEGSPQFIQGTIFREFPSALYGLGCICLNTVAGGVFLMGTGR